MHHICMMQIFNIAITLNAIQKRTECKEWYGNNIFVMGYWDNCYEVAVRNEYYYSKGTGAEIEGYQYIVMG
ncbi:hypothetical protein ACUH7Y_21940 [Clostridium beijerinckii]|uniref:Uncharacterized protein n=2 Tax=Clostridium beijerinckii TaxID=1520 RepID=A0A1S8S7P4_CLOBE|nr:hypothetical protein [Clostridium beijerinckii]OOM61510.1 hypothetical protein CLBCK_23120 [Clostridium beijerinckii]